MPPDFTAVKFFASLMNTSSIPPEITGDSFFFPLLKVFFPAPAIKKREMEREGGRREGRGSGKERDRREERDHGFHFKIHKEKTKFTKKTCQDLFHLLTELGLYVMVYFSMDLFECFYPTGFLLERSFICVCLKKMNK